MISATFKRPIVARGSRKMMKKKNHSTISKTVSDLPEELLGEILSRLDFIDLARSKSVSRLWSSAAESVVSPIGRHVPWLLIPPQADAGEHRSSSRFFNPADGRIHATKALPEEVGSSFWIGSSHGHLIGLTGDGSLVPFVFNPLTGAEMTLPRFDGLTDWLDRNGEEMITASFIRSTVAYKAIITSDLSVVVLLVQGLHYQHPRRLAICPLSEGSSWRKLDGRSKFYHDVSSVDGKIFALGKHCSIEVWNSDGSRVTTFVQPAEEAGPERFSAWSGGCSVRYYFVAPLLIARLVGESVTEEGKVLETQEELMHGSYPYRTVIFEVYKMDGEKKNWVTTKSLGENRALFLGGNHSVSVPATGGIAADCIYYDDDYWGRMDEDYTYGGHDIGVFSLRDGKNKELDEELTGYYGKVEPPSSWIVPTPSL